MLDNLDLHLPSAFKIVKGSVVNESYRSEKSLCDPEDVSRRFWLFSESKIHGIQVSDETPEAQPSDAPNLLSQFGRIDVHDGCRVVSRRTTVFLDKVPLPVTNPRHRDEHPMTWPDS